MLLGRTDKHFVGTGAADQYNDCIFFSKTTDGGKTWTYDLQPVWVHAIAIAPVNSKTLYVATANGVLRSSDGGSNWTAINDGLPVDETGRPAFIQFLAIDPHNHDRVYAASSDNGIFAITFTP
jgi:photosystem II stability/assembly factor-like uncharacterized protein